MSQYRQYCIVAKLSSVVGKVIHLTDRQKFHTHHLQQCHNSWKFSVFWNF